MRELPAKILAVAAVAGIGFVGLLVSTLLNGSWESLFLGVIALVVVGLLLVTIRGQREQRAATKALSERMNEIAAQMDGIVSRPALLSGSQDELLAEVAARFDWIARRQAEVVRLLKDRDADRDSDVGARPGQGSAVDA